ncbi:hypothetical protein BBJ29_007884 [Phytophthora kernoviae]|uniref:Uncharacterized protein n=1 Tax=Phytophthora kernoviae TaxID=325452 RepID=A0A3F2RL89_9STRA|nr:hypothetical protein BBP00_00006904 [Phytophthora kernoviae]RLN60876.1 hypothetical protein BBJ29_007884 [Phytophthora kernoviae]
MAATRKRAAAAKGGNGAVVGFALVVAAGFFSIPFIAHFSKRGNFTAQKDPLNSSQIRRGAYANSGSRDAGADPDWDIATGTYHGRRAPRAKEEQQHK